jgi:putative heme-binding domain-containing protein
MGNVTSSDVPSDGLRRRGATYVQVPEPDFIRCGNPWFTPVAVLTGPDGLLYVLDWHDRRHCESDMLRKRRTADHPLGRLYRVRYGDTYRPAGHFDLSRESDEQLVQRLHSPNIYFRSTAQRLLVERNSLTSRCLLRQLVHDGTAPRSARMHALWALVGGGCLEPEFHLQLLGHSDPGFRAWGVRAAGEFHHVAPAVRAAVVGLAQDPAPDVRLQVAIAARKIDGVDPLPQLLQVARCSAKDPLIPAIVWQNLLPLLDARGREFLALVESTGADGLGPILARAVAYLMTCPRQDAGQMVRLFEALTARGTVDDELTTQLLVSLADKIQTGEMTARRLAALEGWARSLAQKVLHDRPNHPARVEAVLLAATLKDADGIEQARRLFCSTQQPADVRLKALAALVAARDEEVLECVARALADARPEALVFGGQVLAALRRSADRRVADVVLARYSLLPAALQAQAVDLLIQRPEWSRQLLRAVEKHRIPARALSANQVRQLLAGGGSKAAAHIQALWGAVRQERDPRREQVVARMRDFLHTHPGSPAAGRKVFRKLCAQCHKIYGEGTEVGPDLTSAGRSSYDQMLAKVFDPNQYIKAGYKVVTATTTSGRTVSGLVVEDNASRLVLKTQGGHVEVIPRAEVDLAVPSKVSLMPEGVEDLLTRTELADLFAFLSLDRPPEDPHARKIPGAPP